MSEISMSWKKVPVYLQDTTNALNSLPISSEDIQAARNAALNATNGILGWDSNFVMSIRNVMIVMNMSYCLQEKLCK